MRVTILADASWCPETHAAGYGFWAVCDRGNLAGGGRFHSLTVQGITPAEMMALVNALHCAWTAGLVERGDSILFQSDCRAALQAFEGLRIVTDALELRVVSSMKGLLAKLELDVEYRHVKAHTGRKERRFVANHMCDKRAKQAMRAVRAELGRKQNDQADAGV